MKAEMRGDGERIDDRDDQLHDYIQAQVGKKARLVESLGFDVTTMEIPNVQTVIENFNCSICMEPVNDPTVIKHCLHFFCKQCVEKSIRHYKKECPLCKLTMKTHRELRSYAKMQRILKILMPLIQASVAEDHVDLQ
mmetsp:Transcript_14987/g.20337  ORF Transcript_14987/g.20337 Transcript_14987/m.20337 type:complete len:137 (-) Transcript_14987:1034-1444(-)